MKTTVSDIMVRHCSIELEQIDRDLTYISALLRGNFTTLSSYRDTAKVLHDRKSKIFEILNTLK